MSFMWKEGTHTRMCRSNPKPPKRQGPPASRVQSRRTYEVHSSQEGEGNDSEEVTECKLEDVHNVQEYSMYEISSRRNQPILVPIQLNGQQGWIQDFFIGGMMPREEMGMCMFTFIGG